MTKKDDFRLFTGPSNVQMVRSPPIESGRYLPDLPMLAFSVNGQILSVGARPISLRFYPGGYRSGHAGYLDVEAKLGCSAKIGYV